MIAACPTRLDQPHEPAELLAYVSASRLNLWLRCPLAFRLRYVEGLRSPPTMSLFVGKQVHAGLERYYRHRQLGIPLSAADVVAELLATWEAATTNEQMRFANAHKEEDARRQVTRLVAAYLGQVSPAEPPPLAVETTLECPLVDPATGENLGVPLLGVVDLALDDPAGPVIVDFKTAARSSEACEVLHEVQLSSYSWLFRQATGTREASLEIRNLIKTKIPKIELHRYPARSPWHFRRFFQVVRAYLEDVQRGRSCHRPGLHCSLCEFRESHCRT